FSRVNELDLWHPDTAEFPCTQADRSLHRPGAAHQEASGQTPYHRRIREGDCVAPSPHDDEEEEEE
ncbi:hypothetical protein PENTCL1PPCAC_25668, partial [Pristionchus entomophagus]